MRRAGSGSHAHRIARHVWDLHFDPSSNIVDVVIRSYVTRSIASFSLG